MKIVYRTTDLKRVEIELKHAIDVQVNGIVIEDVYGGIIVRSERNMLIKPCSGNTVEITQEKK